MRFHDLRHAHATLMLLQGVHPKVVSERLGHASIGITLDTYSHVLPVMQAVVAAQLDGVHIVVADPAGAAAVEIRQPGRPALAWSSGGFGLRDEFALPIPPGPSRIGCFTASSPTSTPDARSMTTFEVVDPGGYWTSTDLACGPVEDAWSMSGWRPVDAAVASVLDAARSAAPGIVSTDVIDPAGYTAAWSEGGLVRVLRDGDVVAWMRDALSEGWQFTGYACPGTGIRGR
jgi:hypothetical protein